MNWIDDVKKAWRKYADGDIVDPEPFIIVAVTQAYERGTQEALAKVEEWVKENEYCSKCCSPKKYCKMWGTSASATDTDDLLHHLQQLKDNTKTV